MYRVIFLLLFGMVAMSSCGQKAADTTKTDATVQKPAPSVVPTNTANNQVVANQPKVVVNQPPAGTIRSAPQGAPLGSISNPIMNGLNEILFPNGAPKPAAQRKPEPPQNAAGVWHYTCSTGCAGGAGSAVPCKTCGKTLAHNQEYHK